MLLAKALEASGLPIDTKVVDLWPEDPADLADGVLAIILDACLTIADCNDNGVPDECDIDQGTSDDDNGNGIPDECECTGDLDFDGLVGFNDLLILLADWGGTDADLDGDDLVGFNDLLVLLAAWGPCP